MFDYRRFNARKNKFQGDFAWDPGVRGCGATRGRAEPLEKSAPHDEEGDGEIDNQTGDIDEGSDEGCGGSGGVGPEFFEHDREHAAGDGTPEHYSHQGKAYGKGDEPSMFSIGMEDLIPKHDPGEADDPERGTEQEAGQELAPHDAPPVNDGEFAERHGLDDQGRGLGAAVASAGDNEGDEEGEDDGFSDLIFKIPHCGGGQHFAEEEDDEPDDAFFE